MVAGYEYYGARRYTDQFHFDTAAATAATASVSDSGAGPIFNRGTETDSAYLDYRIFHAAGKDRRLGIVLYNRAAGDLIVTVEDNFGRKFAHFPAPNAGRNYRVVFVPDDATAYRLRFSSPAAASCPLPTNINIYQIDTQPE